MPALLRRIHRDLRNMTAEGDLAPENLQKAMDGYYTSVGATESDGLTRVPVGGNRLTIEEA